MASGGDPRHPVGLPVTVVAFVASHKHKENRPMSQEKNRPEREFRAGQVAASVWPAAVVPHFLRVFPYFTRFTWSSMANLAPSATSWQRSERGDDTEVLLR